MKAEGEWSIGSKAPWILFLSDKQGGNGNQTISVYIEENGNEESRSGTFVLKSVLDPSKETEVSFTQEGKEQMDSNGLILEELNQNFAVGWGYNAFGEYASVDYVKGQILNYEKIRKQEDEFNHYLTDEPRYELQYTKITANSVDEYSSSITDTESAKLNLGFYKREVTRRFTTTDIARSENSFASQSILNIVAERYVSEGAIRAFVAAGRDIFTADFKNDVIKLEKGENPNLVNAFIAKYGTHVVLSAYLGGRLDYSLNIKKTTTTKIETCVVSTYKKIFGKSKTMTTEEKNVSVSISEDYSCHCNVKGGEAKKLQTEVDLKTSQHGVVDPNALMEWESSFNDAETMLKSGKATLIETKTIPIFDLVTNKELKQALINAITKLSKKPENSFYDYQNPAYYVDITKLKDYVNVVTGLNKDEVIAEINQEYIPAIRTDALVTVVYPINSIGCPDLLRGLFLGDGEGHAPGVVKWDGNKYDYIADSRFGNKTIINRIYIYKHEVYGRIEPFFPVLTKATVKIHIKEELPNKMQKFNYFKFSNNYWLYSPSLISNIMGDIKEISKLKAIRICTDKDMQNLNNYLSNDLTPFLKQYQREDKMSFWISDNDSFRNIYTIYNTGKGQKTKGLISNPLLLIRNETYKYSDIYKNGELKSKK